MFLPSLVLVSEFARRGVGEGLFGAFQMAGSVVLGLVSWRVRGALASE